MLLLSPGELIVCPTWATLWCDVNSASDLGSLVEGDVILILGEEQSDLSGVSPLCPADSYMLIPVLSRLGVGWIWSRAFETR